jgi:hypothetical protein
MLGKIVVINVTGTNNDDDIDITAPPAGSEYVVLFASGWHNMVAAVDLTWGVVVGGLTDSGKVVNAATGVYVPIGDSIVGYQSGQIIRDAATVVRLHGNVDATHHLSLSATVLQRPLGFEQAVAEWRMLHPGEEVPPDLFDALATITGYSSTLIATEWNRLFPGETVPDDVYTLLKEKAYYRSALRLVKER